jgi:tetratricopeptide (TPR) repeat protein
MTRNNVILLIVAAGLAACAPSLKKIEAQREKDPQFQYDKAVVCMQYALTDEAFKYLNLALALDPKHALAHNLKGLAFMIKANLPEAVKSFQACLAVNPNFSEARNNLGTAFQESGQIDAAEAEFKKAVEIDQNYNASYNLAKLYYSQNKLPPALESVRNSLQKYDRSLLAWNLQGLVLEGMEKYDDAVACYQQALKIVPGEVYVSFNLAAAYYKSGQYSKAKDILEKAKKALDKNPPNSKDEDLKGKIQELLKRLEKTESA